MASLGRPALRAALGLSQAPPLARSRDMSGLSDAEALRRVRRDPEAIVALYDRHVARLVAALAAASGDRELAFDLAQETFGEPRDRRDERRLADPGAGAAPGRRGLPPVHAAAQLPSAGRQGAVRGAGRGRQALRDGEPGGWHLLPRRRALEAGERRGRRHLREPREGGGADQRGWPRRVSGCPGCRRPSPTVVPRRSPSPHRVARRSSDRSERTASTSHRCRGLDVVRPPIGTPGSWRWRRTARSSRRRGSCF